MSTADVVQVRWQPEPADLQDALEASNAAVRHRRRHLRTWWYVTLLLALVVAGIVFVLDGPVVVGMLLLVLGYGSAILQGGFAAPVSDVPGAVAKAWAADSRLRASRSVVVGPDGWEVRAEDGMVTFRWSAVHHVAETADSFLLANVSTQGRSWIGLAFFVLVTASRPAQTTVVPKRALSDDDVVRLRSLVSEHVPAGRRTLAAPAPDSAGR